MDFIPAETPKFDFIRLKSTIIAFKYHKTTLVVVPDLDFGLSVERELLNRHPGGVRAFNLLNDSWLKVNAKDLRVNQYSVIS